MDSGWPDGRNCTKCDEYKALDQFSLKPSGKYGRHAWCKSCMSAHKRSRWHQYDHGGEARKEYYREYASKYRNKHPERVRQHVVSRRRARNRPAWASNAEVRKEINKVYRRAINATRSTGTKHVVDHVIPLNHPLICGLHVPWNLRVITHDENTAKSNKWEPWWQ